jgi:hypothetical protein
MKEISDTTFCVIDRATFFPVAKRLARDAKKVYYHRPDGDAFRVFAKGILGDGHGDVTYLNDFWKIKDQIDCWVFPDCMDAGLQLELESQGKPVWGSKDAEDLEQMRGRWLDKARELGMPMPKTHKILGLTNLRLFFSKHQGQTFFVKISTWRGDMETWRAWEPHQIRNKCDLLAMKFGPFQEGITFYVQEKIDTKIESGADTYFNNGQFPSKVILGYEKKGASYFATWKERSEMPPVVWGVMDQIAPTLEKLRYCNMISSEVRIKDGKSYWLDPCFRFPSPAGEEELELYENFSETVWHGANGEFVEPKMSAKFCGEAVIQYTGDKEGWKSVVIPEEVEAFVKLYACGYDDGAYHFPPHQDCEAIGCAIALGDTPKEVLDGLKEIKEALGDAPVDLAIEPLADLFAQIDLAESKGIPFSEQELPEPAEVISNGD